MGVSQEIRGRKKEFFYTEEILCAMVLRRGRARVDVYEMTLNMLAKIRYEGPYWQGNVLKFILETSEATKGF